MAPKRSLFPDDPHSDSSSDSSSDAGEDVEEQVNQAVQSVIRSTPSLKPPILESPFQKNLINSTLQSDSDEESDSESDKEQGTLIETTPSVKSPIENTLTNSTQQLESEEESESDEEQETLAKTTPSEKAPIQKSPSKSKQVEEEESDESENPIETTQKLSTHKPDSGTESSSKLPKSNGGVAKGNEEETLIEEEKKGRVWGFKDEIAVLQGVIDFKKSKHSDPGSKPDDFYNFVKNKLANTKYRKSQVLDKVRRMKKKFMDRSIVGKNPEFPNLHERKCFQLSTVIWGSNLDANFNSKANGSVSRSVKRTHSNSDAKFNSKANGGGSRSAKRIKFSLNDMEVEDDDEEEEMRGSVGGKGELNGGEVGGVEDYPYLMKSFEGRGFPRLSVVEDLKSGLGLVDSSALDEWDSKWKAIREAELDIYARRLALVQEQTSVLMEVMKLSKS